MSKVLYPVQNSKNRVGQQPILSESGYGGLKDKKDITTLLNEGIREICVIRLIRDSDKIILLIRD